MSIFVMKKYFISWLCCASFAHAIPFEELYCTEDKLDNYEETLKPQDQITFSFARPKLLHDFFLPKMRFFGNFVPEKEGESKKEYVKTHVAFLPSKKKEGIIEPKSYSYPQDPISSLIQHLFPSCDNATL
jgi:hypothetical protein